MGRFKVALYDQHSTPTKNFPSKGKSITFKGAVGPVNNLSSQGLFNPNLDFYSIECLYHQQGMQQGQNSTRKLRIQKVFVGQLQIVCAYLSMRLLKVRGKWSCWLVYVTYHEEYGRRTIIFPGETSASGSWRDRGQAISSTLHLNTLLITDQKLISGTVQKTTSKVQKNIHYRNDFWRENSD